MPLALRIPVKPSGGNKIVTSGFQLKTEIIFSPMRAMVAAHGFTIPHGWGWGGGGWWAGKLWLAFMAFQKTSF